MGLFKKRQPKPTETQEHQEISAEERDALHEREQQVSTQLSAATDDDARITALHELGEIHTQLGDTDAAIADYEQSMAIKEQFGPAYNALLNLYNVQRQAAAHAKDDAAIQLWSTKLDDLMAMSKRVMRSKY